MNKRVLAAVLVITISLAAGFALLVHTRNRSASLPGIPVHIEGFTGLDAGTLRLSAETPDTRQQLNQAGRALPSLAVGNGDYKIPTANLPDGTYVLHIDAPAQYFRDPAGYLFILKDGELYCSAEFPHRFNLVRHATPCQRNLLIQTPGPSTSESATAAGQLATWCIAERTIDPCAPLIMRPEP